MDNKPTITPDRVPFNQLSKLVQKVLREERRKSNSPENLEINDWYNQLSHFMLYEIIEVNRDISVLRTKQLNKFLKTLP